MKKPPVTTPKDEISVAITAKSYGARHRGRELIYEGFKKDLKEVEGVGSIPKLLAKDGTFSGGKNLLDTLSAKFGNDGYTVRISNKQKISPSIKKIGKKAHVTLLVAEIKKYKKDIWDEGASVKNDLANKLLARNFPKHFSSTTFLYKAGTIERMVPEDCNISLNLGDKERIRKLYSKAIVQGLSSKNVTSADIAQEKAIFQLSTLVAYADDLERRIKKSTSSKTKDESEWQTYIKEHITNLKEEYIQKIEKLNIGAIDRNSIPDFFLLTQDNFLDVLEIKTPSTALVSYDKSHDNYFLSTEVSKSIAQAEKYIEQVSRKSEEIENYLSRTFKMPFGVVRPGALILIGSESSLAKQVNPDKAKTDFRRLRGSLKDIKIITYTELLSGLRNRIGVLKKLTKIKQSKMKRSSKKVKQSK
jgi:hypothetical protein